MTPVAKVASNLVISKLNIILALNQPLATNNMDIVSTNSESKQNFFAAFDLKYE